MFTYGEAEMYFAAISCTIRPLCMLLHVHYAEAHLPQFDCWRLCAWVTLGRLAAPPAPHTCYFHGRYAAKIYIFGSTHVFYLFFHVAITCCTHVHVWHYSALGVPHVF